MKLEHGSEYRRRFQAAVLFSTFGWAVALLVVVVGCLTKFEAFPTLPTPPVERPVVVSESMAAGRVVTVNALVATALTLTVSTSGPVRVAAAAPYTGRAQLSLAWSPSPDPTVFGYRIYYGTVSSTYNNSATVGNATNATIINLEEGTTYYFAATSYNAVGDESGFSNEAVGTTPFYVSIRAANWSVETYGRAGVTNQILRSTNLTSWTVIKEFIGAAGSLTNVIEPNNVSAWYRVRVKP